MVDITSGIIGVESGGNPYLRNPRSSAGGSGQFIDSTWLNMVKKRRPDVAAGKTDAEILQLKFDPNLSREMTQAYADDNTAFLQSRGIEATPGNVYLAHFAGPGGAAAIHANPGATVEALLGPRAVAANPFLQGKTGQDVIDWAGRKMTPAQHMAKSLRQRYGSETGEGTTPAATPATGMDRLKNALAGKSYDQDKLSDADRLIGRGQDIASTSGNWIGALGGTILSGVGGYQREQEQGSKRGHDAAVREGLSTSTDPIAAARLLMGSSDPKLQAAGVELFTKISATAQKGSQQTDDMREYAFSMAQRQQAGQQPISFDDWKRSGKPGDVPSGYRLTAEGNLAFIPGGPADPATNSRQVKYTEVQSKAANFGNMMMQAEKDLAAFAGTDAQGNPKTLQSPKNVFGATRDAVVPFEGLANLMTPDQTQNYKQLASQWIRAKLRKESGAVIGEEEMEQEFRTYFPQFGDGPKTIAAKAKARDAATRGMIAESGGAYQSMFPQQPDSQSSADAGPPSRQQVVAPSSPAVDYLRSNPTPEIIAQFEAKYGRGAAQRFLGQPGSSAPRYDPGQFGVSP